MRVKYFLRLGFCEDSLLFTASIFAINKKSRYRKLVYSWDMKMQSLSDLSKFEKSAKIRALCILEKLHPSFYLYDWHRSAEVIGRFGNRNDS